MKEVKQEFYNDLQYIANSGRSHTASEIYYKYLHLVDRRYKNKTTAFDK